MSNQNPESPQGAQIEQPKIQQQQNEGNNRNKEPNTVFIGRKPTMNYVQAVLTNFNASDTKTVTLKARGRAITTAVDVAEITRHRFMKDLDTNDITIGTEEIQREGETRNVSTIEIKLVRP